MAVVAINLQQINDAATTQAWLCRNPEALPLFSTNHRCHHRPPLTFPILPSSCIKDNLGSYFKVSPLEPRSLGYTADILGLGGRKRRKGS